MSMRRWELRSGGFVGKVSLEDVKAMREPSGDHWGTAMPGEKPPNCSSVNRSAGAICWRLLPSTSTTWFPKATRAPSGDKPGRPAIVVGRFELHDRPARHVHRRDDQVVAGWSGLARTGAHEGKAGAVSREREGKIIQTRRLAVGVEEPGLGPFGVREVDVVAVGVFDADDQLGTVG